jgi:hypothetical protein
MLSDQAALRGTESPDIFFRGLGRDLTPRHQKEFFPSIFDALYGSPGHILRLFLEQNPRWVKIAAQGDVFTN